MAIAHYEKAIALCVMDIAFFIMINNAKDITHLIAANHHLKVISMQYNSNKHLIQWPLQIILWLKHAFNTSQKNIFC